MLRLVAAAPSQGLNHTLFNSHGRPGNTEMPQSDSEHCHISVRTHQYKITVWTMCVPLTAPTLTKTTSLFIPSMVKPNSLQFALSNQGNMSPAPMQRPAWCGKCCLEMECNLVGKYSRCHLLPALQWNNKQNTLVEKWLVIPLSWGYIRFMNCQGSNNSM